MPDYMQTRDGATTGAVACLLGGGALSRLRNPESEVEDPGRCCGDAGSKAAGSDCKSFRIRTYEKMYPQALWNLHLQIIGLKVPWNEQLQKTPGGRVSTGVANAGLKDGFCCAHLHLVVLSQLTCKTHNCVRPSRTHRLAQTVLKQITQASSDNSRTLS